MGLHSAWVLFQLVLLTGDGAYFEDISMSSKSLSAQSTNFNLCFLSLLPEAFREWVLHFAPCVCLSNYIKLTCIFLFFSPMDGTWTAGKLSANQLPGWVSRRFVTCFWWFFSVAPGCCSNSMWETRLIALSCAQYTFSDTDKVVLYSELCMENEPTGCKSQVQWPMHKPCQLADIYFSVLLFCSTNAAAGSYSGWVPMSITQRLFLLLLPP